jgi:6,7-dimethyl-8-ribityllumazine synthase
MSSEDQVAVVVESRSYPKISDTMYHTVQSCLQQWNIQSSRISVLRIEDLPFAVNMCMHATTHKVSSFRKPIGFVVIGVEPDNTTSEILYKETVRSLMQISLKKLLPITHALFLQNPPMDENFSTIVNESARDAAHALVQLCQLHDAFLG